MDYGLDPNDPPRLMEGTPYERAVGSLEQSALKHGEIKNLRVIVLWRVASLYGWSKN
jgi:hypothetical protein